jgi:hypothetical protein
MSAFSAIELLEWTKENRARRDWYADGVTEARGYLADGRTRSEVEAVARVCRAYARDRSRAPHRRAYWLAVARTVRQEGGHR